MKDLGRIFQLSSIYDQDAVMKLNGWVRQRLSIKATVVEGGKVVEEFVGTAFFVDANNAVVTLMNGLRGQRTFHVGKSDYTVLDKRVVATQSGWNCVIFDDVSEG